MSILKVVPTLIAISISSPPISLISIAGPGLAVCGCVRIQCSSLGDGQTTTETELAGRQTAVLRPRQPLIWAMFQRYGLCRMYQSKLQLWQRHLSTSRAMKDGEGLNVSKCHNLTDSYNYHTIMTGLTKTDLFFLLSVIECNCFVPMFVIILAIRWCRTCRIITIIT